MAYLTEDQRKEKIIHNCNYFQFESCADLSIGVTIRCLHYGLNEILKKKPEILASDSVQFAMWWSRNFHTKLNGFSGIDTIKFTLVTT